MLYKQNMVTHRRWKMQEKAINRCLCNGYCWKRGKGWGRMETLEEIKTYIADMEKYCKIINSDATMPCKIAFTNMMRDVALRIVVKCGKLEKELERNADTDR